MPNSYFTFKQFTINQDKAAFKVGTDGVLLGAYAKVSDAKSILDIGTGTGLIAIMSAQRSDARITAIEPDQDSCFQASENVSQCRWSDRIEVLNTSLQEYNVGNTKFDLIVSNPPYFADSLKNPDPRKSSVRHNDTLSFDDLLKGVSDMIADNGLFQVILPYAEGNVLIAYAQASGLYCVNILKIRPLPTSDIKRLILTFSKQRLKVIEKFLTIEHGKRHDFTEEYVNLTKEFYLNF